MTVRADTGMVADETVRELIGVELADWLVDRVGESIGACDALVTATGSAGALESVGFWGDVVERGPRFANPRTFPWTLASAPAGHLAMRCSIGGPVVNFVGGADAAAAALESALDLLDGGLANAVAVVAFDRHDGVTSVAAQRVEASDLDDLRSPIVAGESEATAVAWLRRMHDLSRQTRIAR